MTQSNGNNPSFQQDNSFQVAAFAANMAESKKAIDTVMLDIEKVSSLADYFVICSGDTLTQVQTIADTIDKHFRKNGFNQVGSTPQGQSSRWCLLDYGDVVVHVMHKLERERYQLESFWSHGNLVPRQSWHKEESMQEAC